MLEKLESPPIVYLADFPQHLSTVAGWIFAEWGHLIPSLTLNAVEEKLHTHLNHTIIPLTLVALLGDQPVGTASLMFTDMSSRPDLSPWLASVYVAPEHRKQGIGSQLTKAIEEISQGLHVKKLFLFTPDQEHFYARLGWSVLDRTEYRGQQVVVMYRTM